MTTVNPVQSTTYSLSAGNNPATFGSGTKITASISPGVYGGLATAWTMTNAGGISSSSDDGVHLRSSSSVTNQATGTISGYGSGVYMDATSTVANAGTIHGTATTGGTGGGVWLAAGGTVTNTGKITSAANYGVGWHDSGQLTNSGQISGGLVGVSAGSFGGGAGSGLVTNQSGGTISGGYGGVLSVRVSTAVTNAGSITASTATTYGAYHLGAGVDLTDGGSVTNQATGSISGPAYGVYLKGSGTVTNYGTITGTGAGLSVDLLSSYDRLIAENGSKFVGAIHGGAGALEIAGGTGTLTGLGGAGSLSGGISASFTGFGVYVVDAGANWTLAGSSTLAASQMVKVAGTLTAGAGVSVTNAGAFKAKPGGSVTLGAVNNSGKLKAVGGTLTVTGAVTGAGDGVIKDGGTLILEAAFTENVLFKTPTGTLTLADSRAYTGSISGFSTSGGTALDLEDIGFVSAGEATFVGTPTSGTLTVTDGTHTAKITLVGDFTSSSFVASTDGHGGVKVVDPPAAPLMAHGFAAQMAGLGGRPGQVPLATYGRLALGPPMLAAARTSFA